MKEVAVFAYSKLRDALPCMLSALWWTSNTEGTGVQADGMQGGIHGMRGAKGTDIDGCPRYSVRHKKIQATD